MFASASVVAQQVESLLKKPFEETAFSDEEKEFNKQLFESLQISVTLVDGNAECIILLNKPVDFKALGFF